MGCPQPPTPIQTDNTTAKGEVNNKIFTKKLKSMDLRLHWLRCREAQKSNRFYWENGPKKWGDYHTKQHPPVYHEAKRPLFAGCALPSDILLGIFLCDSHPSCWVLCPSRKKNCMLPDSVTSAVSGPWISIFW